MPNDTNAKPFHCPSCVAEVGHEANGVMWVHRDCGTVLWLTSSMAEITCAGCGTRWEWRATKPKEEVS